MAGWNSQCVQLAPATHLVLMSWLLVATHRQQHQVHGMHSARLAPAARVGCSTLLYGLISSMQDAQGSAACTLVGAVLHTDNNTRCMAGAPLGRCLLLQACCSEQVGHDLGRGEVVQCRTCAGCRTVTGVLQCDPGQPAGVVRATPAKLWRAGDGACVLSTQATCCPT